MNGSDQYADWATIRTIDLQRVATWMLLQIADQLLALESAIAGEIITTDPAGVKAVGHQQNRLAKLIAKIENKIDEVYAEIIDRCEGWFQDLADVEEADQRRHMLLFLGADLNASKVDATAMLILGATLAQWFGKQADDLKFKVRTILTDGLDAENAGEDLATAIRGTPEADHKDGIAGQATTQAETTVRTAADKLPNEVASGIGEENNNAIQYGWMQISILDSRTTQICRAYAWNKWDMNFKPVGKALPYDGGPPRHPNCRSRIVLILLDDPAAETNFPEWVNAKSKAQQDAIFGAKKMQLWRDKKISDADLIRQKDRQLTLEQFRKKIENE